MFVVEVKPKRTWRPLRARPERLTLAAMTPHPKASHFFTRAGAGAFAAVVRVRLWKGEIHHFTGDQARVVECACLPGAFPPPRRA